MKRLIAVGFGILALGLSAAPASAADFYFGEETKGVTLTSNESDLNIRIRMQPRFDYGDLGIKSKDGKTYTKESDLYLRRIRLEMGGSLLAKTIKYNLTLSADKWEMNGNTNAVGVLYSYITWEADDAVNFTVGKAKLPYSRVSLTSSSKQLLIERPVSTEAAKKVFGQTDAYYQPKVAAHGKFFDGIINYEVAFADGWSNGNTIQTGKTVYKSSSPMYVGRVELSPPGWVEKSKSDAHLGKGQHLTIGLDYAAQKDIEYSTTQDYQESRALWGADLSAHYKNISAQFEYNQWAIASSDPTVADSRPNGWYAQLGYFIDGLNIEPVGRYEVYDHNSQKINNEETVTTLGANWYGKGHSLKVGANWERHRFAGGLSSRLAHDDSQDKFQVQAQMYF